MTQLLLAQICRQAEAIRALSQAALTSPSTGSGRAPGELEPLQDCLALLQLYAGMLDDRRVSSALTAPAAPTPQLPQYQHQLEASAPTTAPPLQHHHSPAVHTSVGLKMPRVVFGTTTSSTPPFSEGMSSSPSSPSTSTSASARFDLFADVWGVPMGAYQLPVELPVSPPRRLDHLHSTVPQHHQQLPHNHCLHRVCRPPPSIPSSSPLLPAAASSFPPSAEAPKKRANNVPIDPTGRGKSATKALVRRCGECQRTNTSQWRKGPHGFMLCNACGIRAFRAKDKVSGQVVGYHIHNHEPGHSIEHHLEVPLSPSAREEAEPKRSTIHGLLN